MEMYLVMYCLCLTFMVYSFIERVREIRAEIQPGVNRHKISTFGMKNLDENRNPRPEWSGIERYKMNKRNQ